MIRKQTVLWTTKDGNRIRICDMTDRHLVNTIRMLRRRTEEIRAGMPYPNFQGEMAQELAEQEWLVAQEAEPGDVFELYDRLYLDAERRGLRP